ncbi:class I tRNA ligase family protein [Candidatus Vidania fulgoroideorum]
MINIYKTNYNMKGNLKKIEKKISKYWIKKKIYKNIINSNRKKIILHDGPPYANGNLHLGHILNKILKDSILKKINFLGFKVFFLPGFDCHGIPIEIIMKKKKKKKYIDFRKFVKNQIINQIKIFKKIGMLYDWKNFYKTMSFNTEYKTIKALKKIFYKKYIIKKKKNINWCNLCNSSLSYYEINNIKKKKGFYLHNFNKLIIFLRTKKKIKKIKIKRTNFFYIINYKKKFFFIINKQKKFFKNLLYKKKVSIKYYKRISKKISISSNFILIKNKKNIKNKNFNKLIIFLRTKKKIKKIKIKRTNFFYIINYKKKFFFIINKQKKFFKNLLYKKKVSIKYYKRISKKISISSNFILIKNKKNIKNKKKKKKITKIQVCWRHKKEIKIKKKKQWFIKIDFKNNLNKIIKKIKFFPFYGKNEFLKYIFNKPIWNISRKKKWGTTIPFIINKKDNKIYFFKNIKIFKKYGIDIWSKIKPKKNFKKINETLDVWFDSGVTHYSIINKKTDFYVEGRDQFRGWFNSSLITSYLINKDTCYKNLIIHGFVLDEKGKKLSKSKGNYVDPDLLIEKHSAEIIRLYFLSNNYFKNINFSENKIINTKNIYKKIRYIIKFITNNTINIKKKKKNKYYEIDKYIINLLIEKIKLCFKYDNKFEYFNSFNVMKNFCFKEINNYIEIVKERLYLYKINSPKRISCQKTLKYILKNILIFLSPYISYTCEESWNRKNSIFFYKYKKMRKLKTNIKFKSWNFLFKIKKKYFIFLKKKNIKNNLPIYLKLKKNNHLKKIPKIYIKKILKVCKIKFSKKKNFSIKILNYFKCKRCWNYFKKINFEYCKKCINDQK